MINKKITLLKKELYFFKNVIKIISIFYKYKVLLNFIFSLNMKLNQSKTQIALNRSINSNYSIHSVHNQLPKLNYIPKNQN
jgi:hypothetical protein